MDPRVALIAFPVVFLGELPDKTMFASLLLATRGRPLQVWIGAAAAFSVHVVIAVGVGQALFSFLPRHVVDALVAAMFAFGALYAWRERNAEDVVVSESELSRRSVAVSAFVVIFVAEWGDLTQILTANLAARYHDPFAVGVGALLALWIVGALAVTGGRLVLRFVKVSTLRVITSVALMVMAAATAWQAIA